MRLLGRVEDPMSVLLGAQFAVQASHTEGLPNAILEAMASGLPIVATRAGGTAELIEDGVGALLVAPLDVPGLRSAIQEVVSNPSWRREAGSYNRSQASRFAWPLIVDNYMNLYCDLLSEDRRRPVTDIWEATT